MTKIEIINDIYNRIGLTKKDIARIVDTLFDMMKDNILEKETVKVSGFGSFEVKKRGRRIGRNPKTGVTTEIPPRNVVLFRPSKMLKDGINGK